MVFKFDEAEFHWKWRWFCRPNQRIGMTVEDYYARFRDWKEEMVSLSFPAEEEDYIDGFIENLSWDIRLRLSKRCSSRSRLINAFYDAKFEELMMFIEENLKKIQAHILFDKMPSPVLADKFEVTISQDSACNVFDQMVEPNPTNLQLTDEYYETAFDKNVEQNEAGYVLVEVPEPFPEYVIHVREETINKKLDCGEGGLEKSAHNVLDKMRNSALTVKLSAEQKEGNGLKYRGISNVCSSKVLSYVVDTIESGSTKVSPDTEFEEVTVNVNVVFGKKNLKSEERYMTWKDDYPPLRAKFDFGLVGRSHSSKGSHSSKIRGLEIVHHMFDGMPKLFSVEPNEEVLTLIEMEDHELDNELWFSKMLKFVFDPGGVFCPSSTCHVRNLKCLVSESNLTPHSFQYTSSLFISFEFKVTVIFPFICDADGAWPIALKMIWDNKVVQLNVVPNFSYKKSANPLSRIEAQSMTVILQDGVAVSDQLHDVFQIGPLTLLCITLDQATPGFTNENAIAGGNSDIYVTAAGPHIQSVLFEFDGLAYTEHLWYTLFWGNDFGYQKAVGQRVNHKNIQATIVYYFKIIAASDRCVTLSNLAIMFLLEILLSGIPMVCLVTRQTNEVVNESESSLANVKREGKFHNQSGELNSLRGYFQQKLFEMVESLHKAHNREAIIRMMEAMFKGAIFRMEQQLPKTVWLRERSKLSAFEHLVTFGIIGVDLQTYVWEPGQNTISYVLEDKDVLKRKGIGVRLALKQDEWLNGAAAHYNTHMELLARFLVDWELLLIFITSLKFRIGKSYCLMGPFLIFGRLFLTSFDYHCMRISNGYSLACQPSWMGSKGI